MKMRLLSIAALGFLLALFVLAVAPARADDSVNQRIQALEQELAQLKGEQMELKKEAVAAAAALPTFAYRPGAGVTMTAADGSWGFRTRIRWHYRLNFFVGKEEGIAGKGADGKFEGFSNFDLSLRRVYPYFTYYWDKGLYEIDYQQNLEGDRDIIIQKNEFHVHLEKLNPWLPEYTVGQRVSGFFNKHDTNWGSANGGFFERTLFQSGAGVGAGSQNNGMGLDWHNLPLGPGRIVLLQGIISNQGLRNETGNGERPDSDKRSAHVAIQVEPFSKLKNPWIQGIDFGFSAQLENMHPNFDNKDNFRVRTGEANKLALIEQNNNMSGFRYYLTPGFGWKYGPYWLRVAGGFNRGHVDSTKAGQEGPLVRGSMWRIGHELWLWSPRGRLLSGSASTPGSVMFFTAFERDDYTASGIGTRNGLKACSSVTLNGNCHGAYVYNPTVGLWYFVRPGLSVGTQYAFYHVNKIGRGGDDIVKTGDKSGKPVDFQTLQLGVRVEW